MAATFENRIHELCSWVDQECAEPPGTTQPQITVEETAYGTMADALLAVVDSLRDPAADCLLGLAIELVPYPGGLGQIRAVVRRARSLDFEG